MISFEKSQNHHRKPDELVSQSSYTRINQPVRIISMLIPQFLSLYPSTQHIHTYNRYQRHFALSQLTQRSEMLRLPVPGQVANPLSLSRSSSFSRMKKLSLTRRAPLLPPKESRYTDRASDGVYVCIYTCTRLCQPFSLPRLT